MKTLLIAAFMSIVAASLTLTYNDEVKTGIGKVPAPVRQSIYDGLGKLQQLFK